MLVAQNVELSADTLIERLKETEDIAETLFTMSSGQAQFNYVEDENTLNLRIAGTNYKVTEDAFLTCCKLIGLPAKYSENTYNENKPLMLANLNYWFNELGTEYKALLHTKELSDGSRQRTCLNIVKPSVEIYKTSAIVEAIVEELQGEGEIYFEKLYHTLDATEVSLVIKDKTFTTDSGEELLGGIQIQHSVLGKEPTVISAYVSRAAGDYPGGNISARSYVKWDRRVSVAPTANVAVEGQDNTGYSIYDWAKQSARDVFDRVDGDFNIINNLSTQGLGARPGTFFNHVFDTYSLNKKLRELVQDENSYTNNQSVYDLWSSIAAVAGREEIKDSPKDMRKVMLAAGELALHPSQCTSCNRLTE